MFFCTHNTQGVGCAQMVGYVGAGCAPAGVGNHRRTVTLTRRTVLAGETVLKIPSECWFSHRSVLRSSAVAHIIQDDSVVKQLIDEDQSWAVIIGLTYERTNEYSPWLPYMRFMRRQESTVWWSDHELAETHSPHVVAFTHNIQNDIKEVYDRLFPYLANTYPTMFDMSLHDLSAFTWATLTMWGRAFNVVGYNATVDTEYGLVPIADLLNHQAGKPSTWTMEYHDKERPLDPTMYVLEANGNYNPDDELTISYGDHRSAFNFFVYSGFTPRGQTFGDFISVKVINSDGGTNAAMWGCIGVDGRPQSKYMTKLAEHTGSPEAAYKKLLQATVEHMATWPSTYDQDMKSLADMTTYDSLWAATGFRARFKSVYQRLHDNLKSAIAAGDFVNPKYSTREDKNNECYRHYQRFTNYDYSMDHMNLEL